MNPRYEAIAGELLAICIIFILAGIAAGICAIWNPGVVAFAIPTALIILGLAGICKIGRDLRKPDEWL